MMEQLEQQLQKKSAELKKSKEDHDKMASAHKDVLGHLEELLQQRDHELIAMRSLTKTMQQENSQLRDTLDTHRADAEKCKETISELETSLEHIESIHQLQLQDKDEEISQLKEDNATSKADFMSLQAEANALLKQVVKVAQVKDVLARVRQRSEILAKQLFEAEEKARILELQKVAKDAEAEEAKGKLEAERKKTEMHAKVAKRLLEKRAELTKRMGDLVSRFQS
ncbi:hypothetical protein L596_015892 [Steinernema carpocapsae]|uniref:Uncharacterized protein n=1 Tax=Steinernema carpocapsae TaxID=34508 RepID=A0A4U5NGB5_STECR|nr:hypothetical protein L596_015892 [Steinernema carpocapsae]